MMAGVDRMARPTSGHVAGGGRPTRHDGGFAVKKLIKFVFVVALVFGGWALAAASLHVVRAPGTMAFGYVPLKVQLITKNAITFRETYVDTTKWSVVDAR